MPTKSIDQLIDDFTNTFKEDFIGVNLKNKIGHKLMSDYEELRNQVESLLEIVSERKGNFPWTFFRLDFSHCQCRGKGARTELSSYVSSCPSPLFWTTTTWRASTRLLFQKFANLTPP